MKDKVVLFIATITVFATSCSDMEKSSFENKPVALKKETKVIKSKKKKPKIKTVTTEKSKVEPTPIKEEEKATPPSSENTAMRNILTQKVNNYAIQNDLSTEYCFLIDMSYRVVAIAFLFMTSKRIPLLIQDLFLMEAVMRLFLPAQNFQTSLKVAVVLSENLK